MKELSDILRLESKLKTAGGAAALATVVGVEGSSYRRPGARMLIASDGQMTGGVSGGCLERDVVIRAGGVMESHEPILLRYDTTADFDGESGTGYSLGCGGAIDVLIEPLNTTGGVCLLDWLKSSQTTRLALATVVSKQQHLALRMAIFESGLAEGQILDARTTEMVAAEARLALLSDRSRMISVPSHTQNLRVFVEVLNPPLNLIVFGAGNDVVPLVGFAQALGWRVTVVDVRSSLLDPGRTWNVDEHVRCDVAEVKNRVFVNRSSAVVVMTHNVNHDRQLIGWLAPMKLRYLGLLGPRHRTQQLLANLHADNLFSPVGLDLGANNPEEVALAIVAQVTAVLRGRSGGCLADRTGPIHPVEDRIEQRGPFSIESDSDKGLASCGIAAS